ncbi:Phosphatidylinositol 4-phosphate 5-kinase 1 [Hondaea fermentalgiana]|uniref:MORN repeat-containing protein 3 n=1 Tax=Hondaea fermentalgiana TaxID=2315210 RepID=A0A2R5GTD2_9STRA|nr:Phosphatidylinositol 4-phosphate 5-kinase 1 [Hondaea fermentalgiana]|eukprot:GBG34126.1 Phosphatidylinositol 4-phosphate 5-kinase 1 [Hondaea fermentalgiana]
MAEASAAAAAAAETAAGPAQTADALSRLHPRAFFERLLDHGVRPDGRSMLEARPRDCVAGWLAADAQTAFGATTAKGAPRNEAETNHARGEIDDSLDASSSVRMGGTWVVCGVRVLVGTPLSSRPAQGWMDVNVHGLDNQPGELARHLRNIAMHMIQMEDLCLVEGVECMVLCIDLCCLADDGGVQDAAVDALRTALNDLSLPVLVREEDCFFAQGQFLFPESAGADVQSNAATMMAEADESKLEADKAPFEPLWRKNERGAQKSGTRHTIYWVKRNPKFQAYERDGALVAATAPAKFKTGATYAGDWLEDRRHGFGTQTLPNGTKYQGDFENNLRHGTGTLWVRVQGKLVKRYTGEWKANKRDGLGIHFYDNGDKYEGSWQTGKRHGRGKMIYANGEEYDGDFAEDKRHGLGVLSYPNGNWYEGHFDHDDKHGPGRFFFVDTGKVLEAEWKRGTAACGSYLDAPKSAVPRHFRNGVSSKQNFELPKIKLCDPEGVLADALRRTRRQAASESDRRHNTRESKQELGSDGENGQSDAYLHGFEIGEFDDIRAAFEEVDTERKGTILGAELETVLNGLGIYPLQGDMDQLLVELGAHADSEISLDSVVRLLAALRED